MNKKTKIILFVILIIIVLFQVKKIFINKYQIEYSINNYLVKEKYYKKEYHYYDLDISNKENNYLFTISHNFNKNKHIIKEIKTFKSNKLVCVLPVYKKKVDNNIIYCNLNGEGVSTSYLEESNNKDYQKIKKKIKKYNVLLPTSDEYKEEYKKVSVYKRNLLDNHVYYLWDYKGLIVIDSDNNKYHKILDEDLYDNVVATTVNGYYVLFLNDSVRGIDNIYYYDYKKNKVKVMKIKRLLSSDIYINGVVDNLIYVTDKRNKKEYSIDIKREKIKEVDSEQTKYIVYKNGEVSYLSKSDFLMNEQYFNGFNTFSGKEVWEDGNVFYYQVGDKIYRAYKSKKNKSTLLLELDNIDAWEVREGEVFLLKDDTLYSYTDSFGLRKIIKTNELKYNYQNIYQIGIFNKN